MSELAERIVRELEDSEELSFACPTATLDWLRERIEQALLAERRLAMEEAAKMCTEEYSIFSNTATDHYRRSEAIAAKLRYVATPRGGE